MEQEKIDELKKLIAFGICIRNSFKSEHDFIMYRISNNQDDVFKLLANCTCVFDGDYMSHEFKEPQQTTKLLEKEFSKYISFKKSEQGETL